MLTKLISLITSFFNRVSGTRGSVYWDVNDALYNKQNVHTVIIQEDTVISLAVDTGGNDLTGAEFWNVSGKTLTKGALLTTPLGSPLSLIRLSSGSMILYIE